MATGMGPEFMNPQILLLLMLSLVTGTSEARWGWCAFAPETLAEVTAGITHQFPDVPQWDLGKLAATANSPVLLDIRESEEYAVSHLPGALRVSPDASLSEVRRTLGVVPRGKPVLLYCSVGRRSSIMVERVREGLLADGVSEVASLRGGIFTWAIEGRALVNASGPTRQVHAFDSCWAKLLPPEIRLFGPDRR